MYPKLIIVLTLLLAMVGCGETQYRWKADHHDTNRFYRESAECKLMAKNAAAGIQSNRSPSYTATTYNYGGYQTTDIKPDYMQEALNDINTGVQQYFEEKEVYELCMQSKGYRQEKVPSGGSNSAKNIGLRGDRQEKRKKGAGQTCEESLDCEDDLFCGNLNRKCVTYRIWAEEFDRNHQQQKNGKKCKRDAECPGDDMCGDISKVCVSRQRWESELDQKYRKVRGKL